MKGKKTRRSRRTRRRRLQRKISQKGGANNITVVSAYYQVSSKHSFDEYMSWASSFLRIEAPIVLFTTDDMVDKIKQMRENRPIHIIVAPFESLYMWNKYKNEFKHTIQLDPDIVKGVNHTSELYALWSNKVIWMEESIKLNKFNTDYFLWCDFGCFRNGKETETIYKQFPMVSRLQPGKITALLLQPYSKDEYKKYKTDFSKHTTHSLIGGGIWGGDKQSCLHFRNSYEKMLKRFFDANKWAGQEQQIIPYIFLDEPDIANLIEPYDLPIMGYDKWFFFKYYLSDETIQTKLFDMKANIDYSL